MDHLATLATPDDLARLVADHGQLDMLRMKCFCSREYGKYVSCFADVCKNTAPFLAKAFDGDVVGDTAVTFVVTIPPAFRCKERDEDHLVKRGTCVCNVGYSRPILRPGR